MTVPYQDPQSIHNPATGTVPPASWGDAVRDGLEFLVRPAGCVVQTATAQNINSAAWTNVAWNGTDLRDTDGYHTGTSDVIAIPTGLGGWYNLSGSIVFDPNATGIRGVRWQVNGAGDNRMAVLPATAGLGTRVPFSTDVLLNAGDLLRISGFQNSGAVLPVASGCLLSVRLVALV